MLDLGGAGLVSEWGLVDEGGLMEPLRSILDVCGHGVFVRF